MPKGRTNEPRIGRLFVRLVNRPLEPFPHTPFSPRILGPPPIWAVGPASEGEWLKVREWLQGLLLREWLQGLARVLMNTGPCSLRGAFLCRVEKLRRWFAPHGSRGNVDEPELRIRTPRDEDAVDLVEHKAEERACPVGARVPFLAEPHLEAWLLGEWAEASSFEGWAG